MAVHKFTQAAPAASVTQVTTSAAVYALPTAALATVVQHARRGRLPKKVKSLATYRVERDMKRMEIANQNRQSMIDLAQKLYYSVSRDELLGFAVVMKKKVGPDMGAASGEFVDDIPCLQHMLRVYAVTAAIPDADRGQL